MRTAFLLRALTPYWVTRFRALAAVGMNEVDVLVLGQRERRYPWTFEIDAPGFRYLEMAPGQCVDELSAGDLRSRLIHGLERLDPEILAVTGYGDQVIRSALVWGIRRHKATLLMSASTFADRKRLWLKEWAKGLLLRRCDEVFAAGERATAYLRRLGVPGSRIWKGMNVVDNEWFSHRSDEYRRDAEGVREHYGLPANYFLYVGRLSPEKNLARLLEAYDRYRRGAPGHEKWGLVLVGSGPEKALIEGYIRKRQLEDVAMPGFHQLEELPAFYGLAGCLILPSVSEPWGLVVNEAMAAGLPMLVSDRCGCVPELVHQGLNGYVFDPSNVDELARLMGLMASGQVDLKAMGEESRRTIAPYSPEAWARSLADCIEQTVARKGIPPQ